MMSIFCDPLKDRGQLPPFYPQRNKAYEAALERFREIVGDLGYSTGEMTNS